MSTELLTRKDVARLFQLSPRTIIRLEASGKLKSIKLQHAVRFHQSDIDAFLEEREKQRKAVA